jgi:hypothetical protein
MKSVEQGASEPMLAVKYDEEPKFVTYIRTGGIKCV